MSNKRRNRQPQQQPKPEPKPIDTAGEETAQPEGPDNTFTDPAGGHLEVAQEPTETGTLDVPGEQPPTHPDGAMLWSTYEFRKLLGRLSNSLSTLADEVDQLALTPACDEDYKLQQWHEFERGKYIAAVEAAQAFEAAWTAFEQGFNQASRHALSDAEGGLDDAQD